MIAQLGDDMRTSRKGIELNKAHEGLRLDAYNNAARIKINILKVEIEELRNQLKDEINEEII